ncbi:MAG: hypothetical protein R3F42_11955 [Pseudomonadota bacterium]
MKAPLPPPPDPARHLFSLVISELAWQLPLLPASAEQENREGGGRSDIRRTEQQELNNITITIRLAQRYLQQQLKNKKFYTRIAQSLTVAQATVLFCPAAGANRI